MRTRWLDQASELINQGSNQAAYDLLIPHADDRAGDPDFDRTFGIAALETGNPVEAIIALERALDANADDAMARAWLARAYLRAGETKAAHGNSKR